MFELMTPEKLKQFVLHGLASDIFIAERAYESFVAIGKKGKQFKSKYNPFFIAAQDAFKDQFLIAMARLFDKPSSRHETRCIRGLLNLLENNKSSLPAIQEPYNLAETMTHAGFDQTLIDQVLSGGSDIEITEGIVKHFELLMESPTQARLLKRLKELRDKRLAHNELVSAQGGSMKETIDQITYQELFTLLSIAKNLLGVVGWAYMNTLFVIDGEYHLTDDAKRASQKLAQMADDYFVQ